MTVSPFRSLMAVALVALSAGAAAAQDWPTGPVRVGVGFPAGSSPDTLARLITQPLTQRLGQPVIVDNKPGAGGAIGVQQMLVAGNDHTFGVTINGPLTTSQRMVDDLGAAPDDVRVIATGYLAPLVVGECRCFTDSAPWLTLRGLELVFERNT